MKIDETFYSIVSAQNEVKDIQLSIDNYMLSHFPDSKLPQLQLFFNSLLKSNRDVISDYSPSDKASLLFSATIPLIQAEITSTESFKKICLPLKSNLSEANAYFNIDQYINKLVREYLWDSQKCIAKKAIEPVLKAGDLKIDKRIKIPNSFTISPKAKALFRDINQKS